MQPALSPEMARADPLAGIDEGGSSLAGIDEESSFSRAKWRGQLPAVIGGNGEATRSVHHRRE